MYYANPDGTSIRLVWDGLDSPNGIGLSPGGRILYVAETRLRQVVRRRVVAPGELEPAVNYDTRTFVRTGEMNREALVVGLPGAQELDSLAVDSAGAICVATLLESGITVVSADGAHVEKFTLPDEVADPVVTNICFGGDDMRTAWITLSWTGRVITCRWPVPGLRLVYSDS